MGGLPVAFSDVPYLQPLAPPSHGRQPRQDVSSDWPEFHGSNNWVGLLNPLNPSLATEILKYGRFAQSTYDAYDFDPLSKYCGSCRYQEIRLLSDVGLGDSGYMVTKYLYAAMAKLPTQLPLPIRLPLLPRVLEHWLLRSLRLDSWSEDSNWMGFVAVSDDGETRRLGRRNILVAWRGTCEPSEWFKDAHWTLQQLEQDQSDVKVENGFHSIFTSKSESSDYTKSSARDQVKVEIRRLVDKYHALSEVVSLSITGHSLGGALALLTAHDLNPKSVPNLSHVSVISFGAPRVGNSAFCKKLADMRVRVLRVVNNRDIVPKIPGAVGLLGYDHAGVELELNMRDDPSLYYKWLDPTISHSMRTYLRLVELKQSPGSATAAEPSHPGAAHFQLVSVSPEKLSEIVQVREWWYRLADKGLVQVAPGWVATQRFTG